MKGALWVGERIAQGLLDRGIGTRVSPLLRRRTAVTGSAGKPLRARPTIQEHIDSLWVQPATLEIDNILLVDDVVTSGGTMMGCAQKILGVYPRLEGRIACFALARAESETELEDVRDMLGTSHAKRR